MALCLFTSNVRSKKAELAKVLRMPGEYNTSLSQTCNLHMYYSDNYESVMFDRMGWRYLHGFYMYHSDHNESVNSSGWGGLPAWYICTIQIITSPLIRRDGEGYLHNLHMVPFRS